jgi:hypothetical protein
MIAKTNPPSIWLRIIAWYFKLGGILFIFIAVLGLISGVALHGAAVTEGMPYQLAVVIVSTMAIGLLTTGILLARRLRAGAVLGLVLTLYPLVFALIQRRTMSWLELGGIAVTTFVLLSVWRELEWRRDATGVNASDR